MNRVLIIMLLVLSVVPVQAANADAMFGLGNAHFSLSAGNGSAYDSNYIVFGASASYAVQDGLSVGLALEKWTGGGPAITKYSPFVQYDFNQVPIVHPYVAGFYRHTTLSGLPGIDSVGGRAGVSISSGFGPSFSIGIVHESYLACQQSVYRSCSETYPDVGMSVRF